MEIIFFLFLLMIVIVGLSAGAGVAGRSDYNTVETDAIVPDPLPSKKSRWRRRRRKRLEQMDEIAQAKNGTDSHTP